MRWVPGRHVDLRGFFLLRRKALMFRWWEKLLAVFGRREPMDRAERRRRLRRAGVLVYRGNAPLLGAVKRPASR